MSKAKKTVYVGMSGGVDSSVSAALLKDAGYSVVGVFIKPWQPDFVPCTWRDERNDAQRVAAHLGIPFRTLDASEEYRRSVADIFIREYTAGRTPNPDVLCNQVIKFGVFLDWALQNGADMIATGHYARTIRENDINTLHAGIDTEKDQTYFLWTLTQHQLTHSLFPVGGMTKMKVREEARRFGLPVAEKKDSQGICFLGEISMKDLLSHHIRLEKGDVLNEQGEIIGTHDGALLYTIGERRGFTVAAKTPTSGPHFVVAKNIETNTITVSELSPHEPSANPLSVFIEHAHWIATVPQEGQQYSVRFRYRQPLMPCTIARDKKDPHRYVVTVPIGASGAVEGQSAVLYENDTCIGGGVITSEEVGRK